MYNMHCHVGYIPNGKVIGLSKIARICDMVSKRLQLQERICSDIAEVIQKVCDTEDVIVVVEGEHSCMTARGIKLAVLKHAQVLYAVFLTPTTNCVMNFIN